MVTAGTIAPACSGGGSAGSSCTRGKRAATMWRTRVGELGEFALGPLRRGITVSYGLPHTSSFTSSHRFVVRNRRFAGLDSSAQETSCGGLLHVALLVRSVVDSTRARVRRVCACVGGQTWEPIIVTTSREDDEASELTDYCCVAEGAPNQTTSNPSSGSRGGIEPADSRRTNRRRRDRRGRPGPWIRVASCRSQ
ncbi:unnamed protein product, partial [Trichogramma brassicae]